MQKRNKYVAIIQARVGSSRLPGKCLLPLGDCDSVIEYIVKNISMSEYIDFIYVAHPSTRENTPIKHICEEICNKYGEPYTLPVVSFSGSENNVLKRVADAAEDFSNYYHTEHSSLVQAENLFFIEITADCPFVSAHTIDSMCKILENFPNINYISNTITRCWPDGFDVQIYDAYSLDEINCFIPNNSKHREHGGWNIVNYSSRIKSNATDPFPIMINYFPLTATHFHPEWSVTLDTKEDYDVICDIVAKLGDDYDRNAIDVEVLMLLMKDPSILDKNKNIQRNIPGV
ncbi:MAG: hypothetical protein WC346_19200 [Methanogenium sp.]|jgi:spore coat polysaccharide biosynthesis protein SpsF